MGGVHRLARAGGEKKIKRGERGKESNRGGGRRITGKGGLHNKNKNKGTWGTKDTEKKPKEKTKKIATKSFFLATVLTPLSSSPLLVLARRIWTPTVGFRFSGSSIFCCSSFFLRKFIMGETILERQN